MNDAIGTINRPRRVRGLLLFLGLMGLVWALTFWIVTGSSQMLVMGGMAIAMVIIVVNTLHDWRSGFLLFVFWLLFEDLARKHMGNATLLFFGKDVLAAVTYLSLYMAMRRRQAPWFKPEFLVPLALFFGLAAMQVFNTASPSVLYGLLGLKLYFYYVPLIFVGYAMLRTNQDLDRFLVYSLALGFVIAIIGIIQSIVGPTFLNPDEWAPDLQTLGTVTRYSPITGVALSKTTSVFVSGGRFGSYMILVAILAFGAQAYFILTRYRRAVYGFLGLGFAVVAAMQSGSRGPIIYIVMSFLVLSAGFLWGAPWQWGHGHRLVKAIRRGFLVAVAGLLLMTQLFPAAIGASWAFLWETLSPTSSASELQNRAWDYPLGNLETAFQRERWMYGYGTGTASLGTQYVSRALGEAPPNIGVENGWGVLLLEMGIPGPLLWFAWTGSLLYSAWRVVGQLRQTAYFPVALAICWYAFLLLVPLTYTGMTAYQNYVMNAYLWVLVGILYRLPHLARVPQQVPSRSRVSIPERRPAYAGVRP